MLETSPGVAAEEPPCASCGAPLDGPYCSSCGQAVAAPIAVRRVAGDLKEQLVGLDYRALATVRELFVAPGAMLRGYLAGRRQPYTNPLKLLFLSASLYLLVVTTFDLQVTPAASGRDTGLAVAALMNYLVFVFLVPAAWWLRLLFRRSGHNWAESYVVLCYLWSAYLLVASALGLAMVAVDAWYFFARTAAGLVYLVVALRSLSRVGWWTAIWRGVLFYAGYFVLTGLVMAGIITLGYVTGFEPLQVPFARR